MGDPPPPRDPGAFSLTKGGPFYFVLKRLRLRPSESMRRSFWLAMVLWLPMVIVGGFRITDGMPIDPMLRDFSLHARFLLALPLLINAEVILEGAARSAIASMYSGGLCDRTELDRIADCAERLRSAWQPEALILGVALVGGELVLWQVFGSTGWISGGEVADSLSFPRVWYALVALPVFQFVMFRWLWRWAIWGYVIVRISFLPLAPLATHPDLAAGLGCLNRPMSGFSGFTLAMSTVLSAAWATKMLQGRATLEELFPGLAAFLVLSTVLAAAPLLLFSPHLFRARRTALAQYGDFARDYTQRFHEKWITAPTGASPLGSGDIQSLNDLGSAYQIVTKTRLFAFGPRNVLMIWFAGLVPMIPVFASTLTVEQVLRRIVTTVLGGMPI